MIVEARNRGKFLIHNERCIDKLGGFPTSTINDDLTDIDGNKIWDIVRVYNSKALSIIGLFDDDNLELIWERDEDTIKEGDKVKIINEDKSYTTFDEWVTREIKSENLKYRYDYGKKPSQSGTYRVKHIGKHNGYFFDDGSTLAYIQNLDTYRCYLINVEGLKKVN